MCILWNHARAWLRLVTLDTSLSALLMLSADGTVVVSWYYRAMGATVGKDTWLPSDLDVGNYDNLVIGSNVTIGGGCSVGSPYIAPAGSTVSALQPAYFDCADGGCCEPLISCTYARWMAMVAPANTQTCM